MITQIKKQNWLDFYRPFLNVFEFMRTSAIRIYDGLDEILTKFFRSRIVRQIEPGKFEEIEFDHSNRWEHRRHWRWTR